MPMPPSPITRSKLYRPSMVLPRYGSTFETGGVAVTPESRRSVSRVVTDEVLAAGLRRGGGWGFSAPDMGSSASETRSDESRRDRRTHSTGTDGRRQGCRWRRLSKRKLYEYRTAQPSKKRAPLRDGRIPVCARGSDGSKPDLCAAERPRGPQVFQGVLCYAPDSQRVDRGRWDIRSQSRFGTWPPRSAA